MTSRKPPSQRNGEYTQQRISRALQSMAPGTRGGRFANAAPIRPPQIGPAGTSVATAPSGSSAKPKFWSVKITDATVTTYTIPEVPTNVRGVELNGLRQTADVWSANGAIIDVTNLRRVVDDTLQVEYEV